MKESDKIIASERDFEIFLEVILNPPKPNKALKYAAEEYKALFLKNERRN